MNAPVAGLVSDEECAALAGLASGVYLPSVIVEIGSYLGKSTSRIAKEAHNTQVFAIDLWDMHLPQESRKKARNKKPREVLFNSRLAFDLFIKNIKAEQVRERITWVKGDSKEIVKVWDQGIGLLFLDGSHDFKSVKADYDGWAKWVVSDGYIAFHDASKASSGPAKVIETIADPSGWWRDWRQVGSLKIGRRV